jgi:hypothetical protein
MKFSAFHDDLVAIGATGGSAIDAVWRLATE